MIRKAIFIILCSLISIHATAEGGSVVTMQEALDNLWGSKGVESDPKNPFIKIVTLSTSMSDTFSVEEDRFCTRGAEQICSGSTLKYVENYGLQIGAIGDQTGYYDKEAINVDLEVALNYTREDLNLNDKRIMPLNVKGIQKNGRLCQSEKNLIPMAELSPGQTFVVMFLNADNMYLSDHKLDTVVAVIKIISRSDKQVFLKYRVIQRSKENYPSLQVFQNDPQRRDQCK